jgi:hypothetical protein
MCERGGAVEVVKRIVAASVDRAAEERDRFLVGAETELGEAQMVVPNEDDRIVRRELERLLDVSFGLLNAVFGMDESGHMDAMGLGWVIMAPDGDRPLILQKVGGLQGVFSYVAFAPARGIGVCAAINAFDVGAGLAMAKTANDLIMELAPRWAIRRLSGDHSSGIPVLRKPSAIRSR